MKKILIATAAVLCLALPAHGFDRKTTKALQACHDYVAYDVPEFTKLPEAAFSVAPGAVDGRVFTVNWNINWDKPKIRAAGTCTVLKGEVIGYEDYHEHSRKPKHKHKHKHEVCDGNGNRYASAAEAEAMGLTEAEYGATFCQ